jgi:hypothetical protein
VSTKSGQFQFYASPSYAVYPSPDPHDPNLHVSGVVCVRVVALAKVFLFKFSKTIVLPVKDYVLRGLDVPTYDRIVKRTYRPHPLPLHAQLLGLQVLSEAAATSAVVDGPFTTVFAMTHGMFASDRQTALYVQTLARVQQAMDDLLLVCTDTHAVSDAEAKERLRGFSRTILDLRREGKKQLDRDFRKYLKSGGPN